MTHPFALTVKVLPSGQCITLAVEKLHYIMWVVEKVDREFDLRCTKYSLVRNGRPLTFYDDTKLKDVGIDGPDVLYVEIEGPCPPRIYPDVRPQGSRPGTFCLLPRRSFACVSRPSCV